MAIKKNEFLISFLLFCRSCKKLFKGKVGSYYRTMQLQKQGEL